jgi:hypothetical protein
MNENTNQAVETTEVTTVETTENGSFFSRHKKGIIAAGLAVAGFAAYKLIKGLKKNKSDEEVVDGDYYEVEETEDEE